jgi:hypothetical protein
MSTTELQQILRELRRVEKHPELMPSLVKKMEKWVVHKILKKGFDESTLKKAMYLFMVLFCMLIINVWK